MRSAQRSCSRALPCLPLFRERSLGSLAWAAPRAPFGEGESLRRTKGGGCAGLSWVLAAVCLGGRSGPFVTFVGWGKGGSLWY